MSQQSAISGATSKGSGRIRNLPAAIFEVSRMRLTMERRWSADAWMILAYSRCLAVSRGASSGSPSISENPRIALSGVRNSWLTLARSRSFQELASSASRRAASSLCSAVLASVTSRTTDIDGGAVAVQAAARIRAEAMKPHFRPGESAFRRCRRPRLPPRPCEGAKSRSSSRRIAPPRRSCARTRAGRRHGCG